MQTDRYTRVMLTIIAAALAWICVRDAAVPAYAQPALMIDRGHPVTKVQIVSIDEAPRFEWDSLPMTAR